MSKSKDSYEDQRIKYQKDSYQDKTIYNTFNPLIKKWWKGKYANFSPPQKYSIVNIHSRENTLISSPTGSGKTLSAFTAILNELTDKSMKGELEDRVYCIYISPLKALGNDIRKNLEEPLEEINNLYKEEYGGKDIGIRVGVRSGDTTANEKSKMLRKPPHILLTTPESFAIMLTTKKFREKLEEADWTIIDEIHSIADSKRGVHLSISLERLSKSKEMCRIGLSATVSPLENVAKYLAGLEDPDKEIYRHCNIVDVNYMKSQELKVLSPVENLIRTDFSKIQEETYKKMDELIQSHKTTLIFTNTRGATERVVHHLKNRFPKNYIEVDEEGENTNYIGAHHSSLSYEHRLNIENKLKNGELKAVVSSTSLELGIDIGSIDLVILLGSPKSVARALQRIGRSGHKLDDKSKGRIIVMDRDDLVECSVLLKAATDKKIDKIKIPENVYDVLAQQIFGITLEGVSKVEDVYQLLRKSYIYRNLSKKDYIETLKYLAGEYASLEDRNVYAKIWLDDDGNMGKRGKMARVIYMTNIGTIPDETSIKVKMDKQYIGSIAEPFLEKLKKGDVFVLGGQTYEFRYSQGTTAFVRGSVNRPPTVPSWFSEMLPLSYDLALEIQRFRRYMEEYLSAESSKKDILEFINDYLYVDKYGANSIYEYMKEQHLYIGIPHDRKLIVEKHEDERSKYIIFHSTYGRRANDVLSRALAYIFTKIQGKDVEINVTDNGFYLLVPKGRPVQVHRALEILVQEDLDEIMKRALDKTEILNRRFRHCAGRSLMILRSYKGRSKTVGRQQLSSRLLISAVKRIDNDFIILREARREVLEDYMDLTNAKNVVKGIKEKKINVEEVETDVPSPFAFNLISMGYSDIMKMDDKQEFLKRMHDYVLAKISLKEGKNK